jgi:2'-hydroxyisoflavone reductase
MDLLILGGTGFLGRYLVEAALADGHRPTLFNRGFSGPGLVPEIEKLEGDRDGDLSATSWRRRESSRS